VTTYDKSETAPAEAPTEEQKTTPPELKLPRETTNVSDMQVKAQILSHLSNVRRDEFVTAVFEERFTRAEENLKRFNLTQMALSLMNQSILRFGEMEASEKRQAEAAAAEAAVTTAEAKSPAEAEAQNEAKLRIVE
jgi:hypothetical protein